MDCWVHRRRVGGSSEFTSWSVDVKKAQQLMRWERFQDDRHCRHYAEYRPAFISCGYRERQTRARHGKTALIRVLSARHSSDSSSPFTTSYHFHPTPSSRPSRSSSNVAKNPSKGFSANSTCKRRASVNYLANGSSGNQFGNDSRWRGNVVVWIVNAAAIDQRSELRRPATTPDWAAKVRQALGVRGPHHSRTDDLHPLRSRRHQVPHHRIRLVARAAVKRSFTMSMVAPIMLAKRPPIGRSRSH